MSESFWWVGVPIYTRRLRDWFRVRYWAKCWFCDLERGPYVTRSECNAALKHKCPGKYWRPEKFEDAVRRAEEVDA